MNPTQRALLDILLSESWVSVFADLEEVADLNIVETATGPEITVYGQGPDGGIDYSAPVLRFRQY